MPLVKDDKLKIIKKFSQGKTDTGSPEVQAALLTAEVTRLQGHLKEHKSDIPGKRAVLSKVAKRRRLLRYLASRDQDRYQSLIKKLDLKK